MSARQYATADEAESAFYQALERGDLEALMAVWATDEEVVCIHPGGQRLEGFEAIRDSWRKILGQGNRLSIRLSEVRRFEGMMYAVHVLCEWVSDGNRPRQAGTPVFCTNAYLLTDRGWRMVLHHASPAPQPAAGEGEPRESRGLLH